MKISLPLVLVLALSGTAAQAAEDVTFDTLDVDKSGMIDRQEAQRLTAVAHQFNRADANGDGQLDATEFAGITIDSAGEQPVGAQPAS